jgi:hypothetical protein
MSLVKPGARLKSIVCNTEAMVIKYSGEAEISCGGAVMIDAKAESSEKGTLNDAFAAGSLVGKRYVDADDTMELLCVKPGAGSLSVGDAVLVEKSAKSLPSSD